MPSSCATTDITRHCVIDLFSSPSDRRSRESDASRQMMTLYATGIRRAEPCRLSPRMVIHIRVWSENLNQSDEVLAYVRR